MHGDKDIGWGAPKRIQQLKNKDDNRYHNKNKLCKFHKGEHQFTEMEVEYFFNKPWLNQWKCKCGKKGKREYIDKPSWLN